MVSFFIRTTFLHFQIISESNNLNNQQTNPEESQAAILTKHQLAIQTTNQLPS